jgi:hypothetical protein
MTYDFVEDSWGSPSMFQDTSLCFPGSEVGSRVPRRLVLAPTTVALKTSVGAMVTVVAAGGQTGRRVDHEDTFKQSRRECVADSPWVL